MYKIPKYSNLYKSLFLVIVGVEKLWSRIIKLFFSLSTTEKQSGRTWKNVVIVSHFYCIIFQN